MRVLASLMRSAICAAATAAFLPGCGGSQVAIGPAATSLQRAPVVHSKTWMLAKAKSEDLLYVADSSQILVFDYPSGDPVGAIAFNAYGLCSDEAGNVFAIDLAYRKIVEYAHGSLTPIATLRYPNNNQEPLYCADDPNSTNLAVTTASSKNAGVSVFSAEKRPPKNYYYTNYNASFWQCVYDSSSNLFVNVTLGDSLLTELPKGGSKFLNLKLKGSVEFRPPTPVQWDGKYLVIGRQTSSSRFTIYRLKIRGTSLSVVGTTVLNAYGAVSIWFQPGRLIGTSTAGVSVWKYPAGGSPVLTIPGTTSATFVTLSLAPK